MNDVNFSSMKMPQLVSFYNRHSLKPVKRFTDRTTAERRCAELFASLKRPEALPLKVMAQRAPSQRPAMSATLKLDRTIACVQTGETWKNAFRMWRERPDWLTGAQVDRLTLNLYAAAKRGERAELTINDRTFRLVNVAGA